MAARLKQLAAASNGGQGLSLNAYAVAVLENAATEGVLVETRQITTLRTAEDVVSPVFQSEGAPDASQEETPNEGEA